MRKLLSFLVWLCSFWTWKGFFLRWLRSPASHLVSGETAEHLPSHDGQQESELARFLSSLPEDGRQCRYLSFHRDSKVRICFGSFAFTLFRGTRVQASYREFLQAIASSEILFCEEVTISLKGDGFCKHLEAFANALHQSGNGFSKLYLQCWDGAAVPFVKCALSVLLEIDAIQHLSLDFLGYNEEMGKELAAKFMSIIAVPQNLRILKTFKMDARKLDGEGMEQLMKLFQGPPSALKKLSFLGLTSDAQLEHISGMLAISTSLKSLRFFYDPCGVQKVFTRGYHSIVVALCSNQSLKAFHCDISSSMEMKVLLERLIPKNNNLQCNTTLIKLELWDSIGGKEGIENLVELIHNNTSLLELSLYKINDLSLHGTQGIENVLVVLEAVKKNKSLKRIRLGWCRAVSGFKVLGAMMDLLLENHNIEDIDLDGTGLKESGDADYVYSTLSKRKKIKLWDTTQNMAIVNPTSERVFMCGQPFANKLYILMFCV